MKNGNFLLTASHLVVSPEKVFSPGGLIISEGRVLFSGDAARARLFAPSDFEKVDLPECVVLPGFVNAHTHLCIPEVGRDRGGDFVGWILEVMKWRLFATDEEMRKNVRCALEECARSGVTLVGDISYGIPGQYDGLEQRVRSFVEVIGLSRARWEETKERAVEVISAMGAGDFRLRPGLSPHGLYTTGRGCFEWVREYAAREDLPVQVHFCESVEEMAFFSDGSGPLQDRIYGPLGLDMDDFEPYGDDLVDVASRILPPKATLVHGTYLTPHQVGELGRKGFGFVICVRSNRFLTGTVPPVSEMMDGGMPLAIGTDSRGSGGTLNMFDELRAVADAYHGKLKASEFYPELLGAATKGGAKILRFHDVTGTLEEEKRADFQVLELHAKEKALFSRLLELGEPSRVLSLFVDGKPLFGGDALGFPV